MQKFRLLSSGIIQHKKKNDSFCRKNSTYKIKLDPPFKKINGAHGAENIQHIQHIQHFSRKKRVFGTLDPTWFNIFNISAERSTFWGNFPPFSRKSCNICKLRVFSAWIIQHAPQNDSFVREKQTYTKQIVFLNPNSIQNPGSILDLRA